MCQVRAMVRPSWKQSLVLGSCSMNRTGGAGRNGSSIGHRTHAGSLE